MRFLFILLFFFFSNTAFSQIHFPEEFKLIKGDNGAGEDGIYTDGRYSFDTHKLFRDYDNYKSNDDGIKNIYV